MKVTSQKQYFLRALTPIKPAVLVRVHLPVGLHTQLKRAMLRIVLWHLAGIWSLSQFTSNGESRVLDAKMSSSSTLGVFSTGYYGPLSSWQMMSHNKHINLGSRAAFRTTGRQIMYNFAHLACNVHVICHAEKMHGFLVCQHGVLEHPHMHCLV